MILKDASIKVNNQDYSNKLHEIDLPMDAEMKDDTRMGNDTRVYEAGLVNHGITATFIIDAGSGMLSELFGLRGASAFPIVVRVRASDPPATDNPEFSFDAVMENFNPLAGSVGDKLYAKCSFKPGGGLAGNLSINTGS
jgi:hypothetical protein